jgi:hypothetical protein
MTSEVVFVHACVSRQSGTVSDAYVVGRWPPTSVVVDDDRRRPTTTTTKHQVSILNPTRAHTPFGDIKRHSMSKSLGRTRCAIGLDVHHVAMNTYLVAQTLCLLVFVFVTRRDIAALARHARCGGHGGIAVHGRSQPCKHADSTRRVRWAFVIYLLCAGYIGAYNDEYTRLVAARAAAQQQPVPFQCQGHQDATTLPPLERLSEFIRPREMIEARCAAYNAHITASVHPNVLVVLADTVVVIPARWIANAYGAMCHAWNQMSYPTQAIVCLLLVALVWIACTAAALRRVLSWNGGGGGNVMYVPLQQYHNEWQQQRTLMPSYASVDAGWDAQPQPPLYTFPTKHHDDDVTW